MDRILDILSLCIIAPFLCIIIVLDFKCYDQLFIQFTEKVDRIIFRDIAYECLLENRFHAMFENEVFMKKHINKSGRSTNPPLNKKPSTKPTPQKRKKNG